MRQTVSKARGTVLIKPYHDFIAPPTVRAGYGEHGTGPQCFLSKFQVKFVDTIESTTCCYHEAKYGELFTVGHLTRGESDVGMTFAEGHRDSFFGHEEALNPVFLSS